MTGDDRHSPSRGVRALAAGLWRFLKVFFVGVPWHSRHDQMELQQQIEEDRRRAQRGEP